MKRVIAFPAIAATLLAGCAAVPKVHPEVAQVQEQSLGLGSETPAIDAAWWSAYGDPQLDRLIGMGLAGNPTLAGALARVRAAQAQIETEHAGLLPQIGASGQLDRARIGDKLFPAPIGGSDANIGIAVANLSWDLDLFGRQRAMVRQAASSARAAALDAAAARLTISVSIAQTYVGLARANRLIAVADGFVKTRQDALGYAQSRVRNQLGTQFDIKQAETLLAQAEQARTQATQQRDTLVHALAALVGRGADFYPEIAAPTLRLDQAPVVPTVLPADLLGRRPDLLAGQARIDAAVQGRTVARDAFLPNVSISALAGLTAVGLGNFFTGGAFSYSVGPAVSLPIFQGGKLRAQYKTATADLDGAVADYDNAVVGAVREASDAITNVNSADQDLGEQTRVVQGLRDTLRLDQVRVRTGLGSQLDTIDSGFRLLQAEQQLVDMQADALNRRIQLVAALGGGFDSSKPLAAASAPEPRS
ncbi:efflux transporter outer membrane subunit [Sphingomonas oryzagri]|uniref:Efflux transporter outer membrane subunit n=1 Tax=Sphingomonas oryzagri TaxID=3042314 RepID=A0ABT6N6R3_9SPHN|nr:efflux transporter outer membrane subunit [Sphingomonas oryzagri]MDH7640765.1 efflux transporter outer membrane subunit [Sphingomonas oryzagri]